MELNKETTDAAAIAGNENRSEESVGVVEAGSQGSDVCGQEDGALDCGEHELQPAVGEEDRDLLPETRSGQESEGLATGGEGVSESGESGVGSVGRGSSEDLGTEELQEDDGGGSEIQFEPELAEILGAREALETVGFASGKTGSVDRESMTVSGVSLACGRREAKGHYMWLDSEFIDQLSSALGKDQRLKCRLGHPSMFKQDVRAIGYFSNLRRDGENCRGDLTMLAAAKNVPGLGNVADWVMDMAEEAGDMFALSISFTRDWEAEDKLIVDNLVKDKETGMSRFKSPDKLNVRNLPHVRLGQLLACDVVDEGAANDGLFSRPELFAYISGASDEIPAFVPPTRKAEIDAARGAYAQFSAGVVGDEGEVVKESLTADEDEDIGSPEEFSEVAIAAARIPRTSFLEEDFDGESVRDHLSASYKGFGVRPPWDRNSESWALYESLCANADKRGIVLSDDYLALALEACGFECESTALYESLITDDVGESETEVVEHSPAKPESDDPLSGLTEEELTALVGKVVSLKLREKTGRLD